MPPLYSGPARLGSGQAHPDRWRAGRRLTTSPPHAHIAVVNRSRTAFRMASRKAASAKADWRTVFRQSIARSLVIAAALALAAFTLFFALALLTYDSTDAALNTAAGGSAANWMGHAGAWFADLGLSVGGAPIALLVPLFGIMAGRLARPARGERDHPAVCAGGRSRRGADPFRHDPAPHPCRPLARDALAAA
jgi:hypothetical protein